MGWLHDIQESQPQQSQNLDIQNLDEFDRSKIAQILKNNVDQAF